MSKIDPLPFLLWAAVPNNKNGVQICHPWEWESPPATRTPHHPANDGDSTWPLTSDFVPVASFPHVSVRRVHLLKAIKITQCPDFNPPVTMLNIFHLKKIKF